MPDEHTQSRRFESFGDDLERLCDAFESQWRGGERPAIEPLLNRIEEHERRRLLRELLFLEITYRRMAHEVPTIDEYRDRFAQWTDVVKSIFVEVDQVATAPTVLTDCSPASQTDSQYPVTEALEGSQPNQRQAADASSGPRFEIIRRHARGGLGEVFVANDCELNREVALKEIQLRHADRLEARTRFVFEAQVTGKLEHPGIVPVYGMGTYADGRPYYAMRFIRGMSLRHAIDQIHKKDGNEPNHQQDFEIRKLLQRFVNVCHTLQYAHSHGVIHRDLKPDNIMLGEYGETLVVDWGLAKHFSGNSDHVTTGPAKFALSHASGSVGTQLGSTIGTPQFMSPEQAAGQIDELGTSTDVYGLGSTMYSLLTGKPPIDAGRVVDVLEKVKTGEFLPPVARNPLIPRPLNAICLRAMALIPANRYSSARELAEEIERWLADEPVQAYHDSSLERAARWLRRHRTWALAGVATMAVVAIVATFAAVQIQRARAQTETHRVEAVRRLQESRKAIDTWLVGATDVMEDFPGVQSARQRLLEEAIIRYGQFANEASQDPDIEIERARALLRLGDVHKLLGDASAGERAYRDAHTILEKLGGRPRRDEVVMEQANCLLRLGGILAESERHADAQEQFYRAQELLEALANSERRQQLLGSVLIHQGTSYTAVGQHGVAEKSLRESVTILSQTVQEHPDNTELRLTLIHAQRELARLHTDRGEFNKALTSLTAAITEVELMVLKEQDNVDAREQSAACQISLALLLRRMGFSDKEILAYRRAVTDYDALLKVRPDVPRYRESLTLTQIDLAQVYQERQRNLDAKSWADQAAKSAESMAMQYPQVARYREEWATCQDVLGQILRDLNQADEARKAFEAAGKGFQSLCLEHADVVVYRHRMAIVEAHLAVVLQTQQKLDESKSLFNASIHALQELKFATPESREFAGNLGYVYWEQAFALHEQKQIAAARDAFRAAITTWHETLTHGETADVEHRLAWLLITCPVVELREPEKALAIASKASGRAPEDIGARQLHIAALISSTQYQEAARQLAELAALRSEKDGLEMLLSAMVHHHTQRPEQAVADLREARQWIARNCPGNVEMKLLEHEAAGLIRPAGKVE